ncbi:trehalose-6-phosphate synthase domain protein [Teladorsagia circumcincta]|uniref:alpha,alpha-trehalose-phosphate synthase (UDP-forming) n=1 Tax=Teladorsagia circumcincta TaxID=45464 RepID=A0A2G9UHQ3_TELCI|nr:trehalose-6-phosphate synthase domain protein [Teladorsagia circumcincta]
MLNLSLIKGTCVPESKLFWHRDGPLKTGEEMSLLGVLNNYNRGNYKLNPVIVQEEDYNVYYGGISNGLLWPALHNLPEYIVADYDTPKILRDHWCAYVRVNYQFAIDAVRNSRPQDFIWIHDYHLMLTGLVMQSLDPNLEILGSDPPKGSRFFFSVERFDYTKGIKEKLLAYKRYFEKYPDRIGKDVLYQVAVTNRRSVDTYRVYQDECIALAESIVQQFKDPERPEWKPLVFQTDGLPRPELVAAYMAMDIGIVTPKKDGMNLVAKEMMVCNPRAGLILSTGAGSEIQFTTSGLYKEDGEKNYHRISNLFDVEAYADAFYAAATEPVEIRAAHGKRLSEFILSNDIERSFDGSSTLAGAPLFWIQAGHIK